MISLIQLRILLLHISFGVAIYSIIYCLSYPFKSKFNSIGVLGFFCGILYARFLENLCVSFIPFYGLFLSVGIYLGYKLFSNNLNNLCKEFYCILFVVSKTLKRIFLIILIPPIFVYIRRFYQKKNYKRRLKRSVSKIRKRNRRNSTNSSWKMPTLMVK